MVWISIIILLPEEDMIETHVQDQVESVAGKVITHYAAVSAVFLLFFAVSSELPAVPLPNPDSGWRAPTLSGNLNTFRAIETAGPSDDSSRVTPSGPTSQPESDDGFLAAGEPTVPLSSTDNRQISPSRLVKPESSLVSAPSPLGTSIAAPEEQSTPQTSPLAGISVESSDAGTLLPQLSVDTDMQLP